MRLSTPRAAALTAAAALAAGALAMTETLPGPAPLSPAALAAAPGGQSMYVACATARQVIEVDLKSRRPLRRTALPGNPSGLAVSGDGRRLYVTCAAPASVVAVIDPAQARVLETIPAGHTSMSPVLSPDGRRLYVCNRFDNNIGVIDLESRKEVRRIAVEREPVAAATAGAGGLLLVANHLHAGRSDVEDIGASISVVDTIAGKVVKSLRLPNGSGALQDIRISPDGRHAIVTHLLAHHQAPTSQIERGWMNTNAVSIIDVARLELVNTVLLDGPFHGAANPWGAAWTSDGGHFVVAHSGSHEVTITDFPALLAKLAAVPEKLDSSKQLATVAASETKADVPNDLSFLAELRQSIRLRSADRAPRAIAVVNGNVYTANYFSDSLSVIPLAAPAPEPRSIPLGPKPAMDLARKGEAYFHDADLCLQRWQSCVSCHPDVRTDALNWDLLNDGLGNPKNSKSLLYSHRTPPAMSLGIRETAETAVRSGIRGILFTHQPAEVASAIDAFLKSLRPTPSPYLVNGKLSAAALRGQALFNSAAVGCATCHTGPYYTDLKSYDTGTAGRFDKGNEKLDTPALTEVWRTAPYLHDGSAATMMDVLTTGNKRDKHGVTSHLTTEQLKDLAEYVLSL